MWILIVYLLGSGAAATPDIMFQEFMSKDTCVLAAAAVVHMTNGARVDCVAK
jgi:hypothetical protein